MGSTLARQRALIDDLESAVARVAKVLSDHYGILSDHAEYQQAIAKSERRAAQTASKSGLTSQPCEECAGSPCALAFCQKRCVCIFSLVLALLVHGAAVADQPKVLQTQTNPVGGMVLAGANHCCVRIGTASPNAYLDVYQGELKVGSSGVGCSGKHEGELRYCAKHLQLCDGNGWRNVSLDKAERGRARRGARLLWRLRFWPSGHRSIFRTTKSP
ncbi:hypothetical protein IVA80_34600 [Bradyrhizobium sp. 139]|uniref:hypothetical protein n=1 Tax=Bradyrhizobium sp. 139 TaxID=2782616 RepID=UPI001FFADBF1|nr:hypothetical protein [Bradyrhizobium sp. 139]MCK1745758.1 hypothetical protein [Bradyrhizobium sp. 139]